LLASKRMKPNRCVSVASVFLLAAFLYPCYHVLAGEKIIYNGVVAPASGVMPKQSGYLVLNLSTKGNGKFTGTLFIANRHGSFHGDFNSSGSASVAVKIPIPGTSTCDMCPTEPDEKEVWRLELQMAGAQITGQATKDQHSQNGWVSYFTAARAAYNSANPSPLEGRYTISIPGQVPGVPGSGFMWADVDSKGRVNLSGSMADGTAITQSTVITEDGTCPVFSSMYSGNGMIMGYLGFASVPESDASGALTWAKPSRPNADFNPAGFTNDVTMTGSRYIKPVSSGRILNMTNGVIVFQEGNLAAPFTNSVTLGPGNKVSNNSNNKLTMKFNLSNGLFTGDAQDPATGKSFPFKGAVLQKQNQAAGYFRGQNQLGSAALDPVP
jgi:hypothetical protein